MAKRDVCGQTVCIERTNRPGYALIADVYVEGESGVEHYGEIDRDCRTILVNTTRKGEHVRLSRSDLTADMVAEIIEGVKQLVSDIPQYYLDNPERVSVEFDKSDVRLEDAKIQEQNTVRTIETEN